MKKYLLNILKSYNRQVEIQLMIIDEMINERIICDKKIAERTTRHISNGGACELPSAVLLFKFLPRLTMTRFESRHYSYAKRYMKFRTPLLGMEEYVKRNKLRYGGEKHG